MAKTQRAAIKAFLAHHTDYDADTMRITADGVVTAKLDADKTFAGNNPMRFSVGSVSDVLSGVL